MRNFFRIELDSKRVFGLDILRALAILFVLLGHIENLLPEKLKNICNYFVLDGVSIFFVLSGFLIGGILIKIIDKNEINKEVLLNFWIRRWFRTLPNYFLVLSLLCLLHYFFTDDFTFGGVKKYFIFSQNLFQGHPWFFPKAWSLSIEEWFYLLVPVLIVLSVWLFKKTPRQGLLFTVILIIAATTLFRYYRYSAHPVTNREDWDLLFQKQVITRLDSLMFGVIGAYIHFYHFNKWIRHKTTLMIIGAILFFLSKFTLPHFAAIGSLYSSVFSLSVISIAALLLLPFLSELKTGKGIFHKSITYISLTSYSMYLLNLSVIQYWIISKIPWSDFIANGKLLIAAEVGLYCFLVFSLSIILYKYFEVPMTRLRENKKIKN